MHGALVASMWIAVQWHTSASAPASAELWELPPVMDVSPAPTAPQPVPPEAAPPPPQETAAPTKADIVEKRETRPKPATTPPREPARKEHKTRPAAREPSTEELIQRQVAAEQRQREEIQRLTGVAGPTSARPPAVASSGPISNAYNARVQAAVRSHLSFAVPEGVPYEVTAEFIVELLPTGELAAEPRLVKSSGIPGYDEAALRALLRTSPFPRQDNGEVPPSLRLTLRPQDVR